MWNLGGKTVKQNAVYLPASIWRFFETSSCEVVSVAELCLNSTGPLEIDTVDVATGVADGSKRLAYNDRPPPLAGVVCMGVFAMLYAG